MTSTRPRSTRCPKKEINPFSVDYTFTRESAGTVSLLFYCKDTVFNPKVIEQLTDNLKKKDGYKDVPGLGRAVVKNAKGQLIFWDDDTNCHVIVAG